MANQRQGRPLEDSEAQHNAGRNAGLAISRSPVDRLSCRFFTQIPNGVKWWLLQQPARSNMISPFTSGQIQRLVRAKDEHVVERLFKFRYQIASPTQIAMGTPVSILATFLEEWGDLIGERLHLLEFEQDFTINWEKSCAYQLAQWEGGTSFISCPVAKERATHVQHRPSGLVVALEQLAIPLPMAQVWQTKYGWNEGTAQFFVADLPSAGRTLFTHFKRAPFFQYAARMDALYSDQWRLWFGPGLVIEDD